MESKTVETSAFRRRAHLHLRFLRKLSSHTGYACSTMSGMVRLATKSGTIEMSRLAYWYICAGSSFDCQHRCNFPAGCCLGERPFASPASKYLILLSATDLWHLCSASTTPLTTSESARDGTSFYTPYPLRAYRHRCELGTFTLFIAKCSCEEQPPSNSR